MSVVDYTDKSKRRDSDPNNPFLLRTVKHPTTDLETFIHLIKGSLGSGILAMPYGFKNAGLWFGLCATLVVGFICTYSIHILVKCSHVLCWRHGIPSLSYADIGEEAFRKGPPGWQRFATCVRFTVDLFLTIDLLGCCCIYLVFVARNLKQIVDYYNTSYIMDVRIWIVFITLPLLLMCLIRNLKYMVPFSFIANLLLLIGIIITFTFVLTDIPPISERPAIASYETWPLFFGSVIFALECVGVAMSLENEMQTPAHFSSVLYKSMSFTVFLYVTLGFFGYLKYGEDTRGSITLNVPVEYIAAQAVKIMISLAIFFTFTLQFYVPLSIIWGRIKDKVSEDRLYMYENTLRLFLVVLCCIIAIIMPNLGPFISLIGAVCLSVLGLILPAIIELAVYKEDPGYGTLYWRLWKNIFLILFGMVGFVAGSYVSLLEIQADFLEKNFFKALKRDRPINYVDM